MLALLAALTCIAPMLLLLASFVGLAPYHLGILMIAVPTAGIGLIVGLIGWSALGDLLLPHPVLTIDETGILDRRVADAPIPWSDVTAATSLLRGGGGVVLELRVPTPTRLNALRPGTFMFQQPDPGLAHIAVRAMTVPAVRLVAAIVERAERHGALIAEGAVHEKMRRRSWTG